MGRDENDLEDGELEDGEWEDTQQKYSQEADACLRGMYCVSSTTSGRCQVDAEKTTPEGCIGRRERSRADDRDYSKLFRKGGRRCDESKFFGKNTESSACGNSEGGRNVDRDCSRILKKKARYDVRMERSYAEEMRNNMRSAHESRTFVEKNRPGDTRERHSSDRGFSHVAEMEKYLCDGKVTLYARQPCGNQRSSSRSEVVEKNEKLCTSGDRKGNEEYCDVTRSRKRNGKMGERRPVEALLASISTSIQLKSDSTSEIFESGDSTDAYYRRKAQHVQVESSSQITKNNEQKRVDVTRSFTHALTNDLKSSQSSEISEKENKRDVYLLETTGRTTNETDCSRTVEEKQTRHIKRNISGESRHLQGKDNQVKLSTCSSSGIKANAKVIELTKIENCASVDQNVDDGWIFESLGETPKANQVERSEREGVDIEKLLEELEKERMKLVDDRKQMEESLARDKKQLAANLYTLLVTARHQIGQLNADKKSLMNKLEANSVLKCPSCSHIFSTSKNCVKPKYTRVLKGRNTIELCFENFDELKRWLSLNNMERDADGFPVLPEPQATQPTLHSTNSLILAASKAENTQRKEVGKDVGRSEHVSNATQESGLENAAIVHMPCNFNEHGSSLNIEARRSHTHTRICKQCDQRTDNTSTHRECDLMKREIERTSDRARTCGARQKSLERLRKRSHSPLKCASNDGSYWSGRHNLFERTNIKSRRTHYEGWTTHCHFSSGR